MSPPVSAQASLTRPLEYAGTTDKVETFDMPRGSFVFRWTAKDTSGDGCVFGLQVKALDHEELMPVIAAGIASDGKTIDGKELGQLDGGRYAAAIQSTCSWGLSVVVA